MVVGGRFIYFCIYFNIGNVDINLGDDFLFYIKDDMYLEYNYFVFGFLCIYMGLGSSKVFGFFNEVCLIYVYGQGKYFNGMGNDLMGYYQCFYMFEIGVVFGLVVFVFDFVLVEVLVGVMGFSYKWVDQIYNQVNKVFCYSVSGNFKIDLFLINFGMMMYF